ncbi:MAG: PilW family protein [Xanthomonadaceae bacterium]|nr:PilW family protein [Xanthomonadaceae bacterium]MDE2247329.1 PilW family protein [Xanthomonadaceae bacterium]
MKTTPAPSSTPSRGRRERGFSLVELMVGITVSIIGTLAIMAAFANFEGRKRTTTSADDAQQSGSYALYQLEREIRTAGSGLTQGRNYSVWGCAINALPSSALPAPFNAAALNMPPNAPAMPVLIAAGGSSSDVISVMGGNPALQVFKVGVTSAPTNASLTVGNGFGILQNDYLLGTLTNGSCEIGQVSAITGNSITLASATAQVTGLANAVNVFDLGPQPVVSLFGVDTTQNALVEFDQLQRAANGGATGVPIADGIVQLKALYGINNGTAPSNVVQQWVQPTGAWAISALTANTAAAAAAVSQIKAIRIAVVAESRLPERTSDYVNTSTTLTLFPDLGSTLQYHVPIQPQFRYKVYDTTIPLRNALITRYF